MIFFIFKLYSKYCSSMNCVHICVNVNLKSLMSQVLSQSAMSGGRRVGAVDDSGGGRGAERWGRRGNAPGTGAGQSYELSQDLADKRIEMLERR